MRHLRYRKRYLAAALAAAFFMGCMPQGEFMAAESGTETSSSAVQESTTADNSEWEKAVPVTKLEELTEGYKKADIAPVVMKLMQDMIISYPVEWPQTKFPVTIITGEQDNTKLVNRKPSYMLQIIKGGNFKIDNTNLILKGPGPVITVEKEGILIPVNGEIQLYEEGQEGIVIKQGGIYQNQIKVFPMNGTVRNDNIEIPDPTKPTVTQPETTQAPVTKPSEETICLLTTDLISVDSQIAEIRLSIPEVTHDTKEVYIYYSKNEEKWEKVYWLDDSVAGEPKEVKNFVTEMQRVPPYTYIPYEHIFEEYGVQDKIYLKVQIIGPSRSGMSTVSEVKLKDSSVYSTGSSGGRKKTGSGNSYGGSYSGFGGIYGGTGISSGSGASESSGEDDGLPVIFFSRTAPYWQSEYQNEEVSTTGKNKAEKSSGVLEEQTENDPEETSPFEESSSLPEKGQLGGEEIGGNGGVQWGVSQPEAEVGQPHAQKEHKNPAVVVLLLGAAFLLIIGSIVWIRRKRNKNSTS